MSNDLDNSGKNMDLEKIMQGVRMVLEGVGEDPDREGLLKTPERVAKMYAECFAGLSADPSELFETAMFDEDHNELVLVRDIPFYSMCEHHLVPFFGKAHVAYIPSDGRVCGLSKLARLVETFARRPQVQERLTTQVAETLMQQLQPQGVLVVMEAEHLCMSMRGIKKPGSRTTTSAVRGLFEKSHATRSEALSLIFAS